MEHFFTTYVRTKCVFQQRLKDLKTYDTVKIYLYELNKLNVNGYLLYQLQRDGQIWYDHDGNFKALIDGPIEPSILERTRRWDHPKTPLTDLHKYMKKQLSYVTINTPLEELPVYFRAFMNHRNENMDMFFTVDGFSRRVHTPVVNLKSIFRKDLKLKGESLCSLDVKQMQPTILARILDGKVGDNPFSNAVWKGEDVYLVLLNQNKELTTRTEAKKFLFQLIFGKPMDDIGKAFEGDTKWVQWINEYKSRVETNNPHARDTHTNLAWLLQSEEVKIMTNLWQRLMDKNIPFLTIHDDVLVRKRDKDRVLIIFHSVLNRVFQKYEITIT